MAYCEKHGTLSGLECRKCIAERCQCQHCIPKPAEQPEQAEQVESQVYVGFDPKKHVELAEQVDHPSHYGGKDDPFEVIKVMEAWLTRDQMVGALLFNIHKYLARAFKKGDALENIKKANWYGDYLVQYLECHPDD